MEPLNRFSLLRYRVRDIYDDEVDLAVPVIDHVPLYERGAGYYPGIAMRLLLPPHRHWSGAPKRTGPGRPVILDGGCTSAGCCGMMAKIEIRPATVLWYDFYSLGDPSINDFRFEFDRRQYEAAIAGIANTRLSPGEWWSDG